MVTPKMRSVSTRVMHGSGGGECCCVMISVLIAMLRVKLFTAARCDIINFCSAGVDSGGWYYHTGVVCIFGQLLLPSSDLTQ